MPDFPIIDTHLHIWDTRARPYPWLADHPAIDRPFLLPDFDAATGPVTVERMVFVQGEAAPSHGFDEARWVASEAERDPRIAAMVAWAPLEKGAAVAEDLERLATFPILRGIRRLIQSEADLDFCLRPDFIEGVRTLGRFGLSFDICIDRRHMANAVAFAGRCPDVPMVLDHIGKPDIAGAEFQPWAEQIREMARLPHVVCKLSGVATEADHRTWTRDQLKPYIQTAAEAFGFDRLMFGGDWPVSTLAIGYPEWVETLEWALDRPDPGDCRKLFQGTARAFYRLA